MEDVKEQEINTESNDKLPKVESLVFYEINKNGNLLRGYSK